MSSDKLSTDEIRFTTPIHSDSGILTLLSTFGYPGLQVDVGDGVYASVKPAKNTLVVNLGDMLSNMTANKLKATKHRVMDIGTERYSSPFFFEPFYHAKMSDSIMGEDSGPSSLLYGEYLVERMMRLYGEWKDFLTV